MLNLDTLVNNIWHIISFIINEKNPLLIFLNKILNVDHYFLFM